jgi:hypothetical protein
MALPKISGAIAKQVGSIQGKLVSQVQGQVFNILSKFSNQCPNAKEIQKIIRIKNNLLKNINALERRIQKLRSVANKLNKAIRAAKVGISIITKIPKPTVFKIIPGQAGGVVIGVKFSALTKLSDRLIKINKLLDGLEADKAGILGVINTVSVTLGGIKRRLEAIDLAIQGCSKDSAQLNQIVASAQPPQNTGSEGTPTDAQGNEDPDYFYKGYKLEIVDDPNSPKIAPRRYAIAKDRIGVIVLYGPSSFSSDTKVLLDEIKFRIDNQLP